MKSGEEEVSLGGNQNSIKALTYSFTSTAFVKIDILFPNLH